MKTLGVYAGLKAVVVTCCLVGLAAVFAPQAYQGASHSPPAPRVYIALGDSVSSGFGLEGYGGAGSSILPEGRHTAVFFERLRYGGIVDGYKNKAVSGYTTSMLLERLEGIDEETLAYFRNAGVITLNIGGNNILTPFLRYLSAPQAAGADDIRAGAEALAEAWRAMSEAMPGSGGGNETAVNAGRVLSGIRGIMSGIGDLISGGRNIASGVSNAASTLMGYLSPQLEAALEEGVRDFLIEFNQIASWLEINAPGAAIIVNTVYNPIPHEVLGLSVALSARADELIGIINAAILRESGARGFIAVDIFSYLNNRLDMMRFNLNPFADAISFDIVHPNAQGHAFIARLHYEAFMQRRLP